MFQHLDDPAPLPPSTSEQRQATLRRGQLLRRRRHARAVAIPVIAAAVVTALVGWFAVSPSLQQETRVSPAVSASPRPAPVPTPGVGPGTGVSYFAGATPDVPVTFSMPAGWETEDVFVYKSGPDLGAGLAFFDVANIYTDGCKGLLVDPPVGPTVNDLVAAYATVPGVQGVPRTVMVDGFDGKQVRFALPEHREDDCREGKFGLAREEGFAGAGPNLWAWTPRQVNDVYILDVGGTRLVIYAVYPPNISDQDRSDLSAVLRSIRIG